MKKHLILFGLLCCQAYALYAQEWTRINGYVSDAKDKEPMIGAVIYCVESHQQVYSNAYGYFSISVPVRDSFHLICRITGYEEKVWAGVASAELTLQIPLSTIATNLQEVVISGTPLLVERTPSITRLSPKTIKDAPALMGEKDVLKTIQWLPGVSPASEGSTGLFVRGGGVDQNLIVLDDLPMYNSNHLFGYLSAFNGDALKDITFLKGSFPARYGGRLSSILDIRMKDGNKERWSGEGGVGLVSSRFTVEGPLRKSKVGVMASGRVSYHDALFNIATLAADLNKVMFRFRDFFGKLSWDISKKDKIYVNFYSGRDIYGSRGKEADGKFFLATTWDNTATSVRWTRSVGTRAFSTAVLGYSSYRFENTDYYKFNNVSSPDPVRLISAGNSIADLIAKWDLTRSGDRHNSRVGFWFQRHAFEPASVEIKIPEGIGYGGLSGKTYVSANYQADEWAAYAEDEWQLSTCLLLSTGVRVSGYAAPGAQAYTRTEPRVSLQADLSTRWKAQGSITWMNQYVHLLSNSGFTLPTDLWVPSTDRILPQQALQGAMGCNYRLASGLTLAVEGYYKNMENVVGYREGASFVNIDLAGRTPRVSNWQELIRQGKGEAYGLELLVQKYQGRLTGWFSYTYGKVRHRFEEVESARPFYPVQDRRHAANIVGTWQWTPRRKCSFAWTAATGNPIRIPLAYFTLTPHLSDEPAEAYTYTTRDAFRNPLYHRLDASIQFSKQKKRFLRYWDISIANLYNRRNALFYEIYVEENPATKEPSKVRLNKVSVLIITPSISYNIKF